MVVRTEVICNGYSSKHGRICFVAATCFACVWYGAAEVVEEDGVTKQFFAFLCASAVKDN
jgi:hypothetical protein